MPLILAFSVFDQFRNFTSLFELKNLHHQPTFLQGTFGGKNLAIDLIYQLHQFNDLFSYFETGNKFVPSPTSENSQLFTTLLKNVHEFHSKSLFLGS